MQLVKGLVFLFTLTCAAHVYLNPEPGKVECQFYIYDGRAPTRTVRTHSSFINATNVVYEISDPSEKVIRTQRVIRNQPITFTLHKLILGKYGFCTQGGGNQSYFWSLRVIEVH